MKKIKLIVLFVVILTQLSCKKNNDSSEETETDDVQNALGNYDSQEGYSDGTYCADIDYYNPDTGVRNTYTLNVEVENNELTVIHWPNGGWLDSTHFSPEELDSSGSCSFSTYDGRQYDIQITGSECSYTDERKVEEDEDEVRCPQCGGKKYSYDDKCYSCKSRDKDKEEHTCKRCGNYDSFMWSGDELCSDCKRDDEDKKREEEEE